MESYVEPFRSMLPQNARLLVQAGAGDSELARNYRALYPACCTLVVDPDPARAQQAREYAERIYVADLETADDTFYKQLEWADGWYFNTTLEQFHNPLQVLQQVRKVIQFDASIIARVTNRHYWDAPADPPRHAWGIGDMLAIFQHSGFRVETGILLNPAALPPVIEAALRQQAADSGVAPEVLLDASQPSHYLIKAVPA